MGKSLIFSIAPSRRKHARTHKRVSLARKHKGSFTRYCNKHGHRGASHACIKRALKSGTPRRKKQAEATRQLKRIGARRSKK
jgi:hypothetical protein